MTDFNENDLFKVGAITSTHGVHGEVKVFPTTDDIKRFKKQKDYLLKTKDGYRPVTVKSVKYFKQFVILGFEEFSSPEDILPYRRCELYTDREHAIKCEKDEYFIADLICYRDRCERCLYHRSRRRKGITRSRDKAVHLKCRH